MGGEVPERSSWSSYLLTFVLDFTHGALVTAGGLVVGFFAYQLMHYGVDGLKPKTLWGNGSSRDKVVTEAVLPMLYAKDKHPLDARMEKVVSAIARRYHTSPLVTADLVRTVQKEGQAQGVDPLLILSVISIESGFNPFAESSLGAQGLMQVVPRYDSVRMASGNAQMSLFDPLQNIHLGTVALKSYLQDSPKIEEAIKRYGHSHGETDAWFARRVLQNYARFKKIIESDTGSQAKLSPTAIAAENR